MSGQKSFEDTFDHDPNAVYEEEEEEDLGRDDEFKDLPLPEPPPEKEQKSSYKIKRKRKRSNAEDDSAAPSVPGGLMKYVLFALAVTAAYLYMQSPDEVKKAALQTVRKNIITETGDKKDQPCDIRDERQSQQHGNNEHFKTFEQTKHQCPQSEHGYPEIKPVFNGERQKIIPGERGERFFE